MLTLSLRGNDAIEERIFGDLLGGQKVCLMDDDTPIGIAVFGVSCDKIVVQRVGILKEFRGRRFGDFFMRSLIFKFSLSGLDILIDGQHKYFEKFGFNTIGGQMLAMGGEISFPSNCKS